MSEDATLCAWGRTLVNPDLETEPCPQLPTTVLVIEDDEYDEGDRRVLNLCVEHMTQLERLGMLK